MVDKTYNSDFGAVRFLLYICNYSTDFYFPLPGIMGLFQEFCISQHSRNKYLVLQDTDFAVCVPYVIGNYMP